MISLIMDFWQSPLLQPNIHLKTALGEHREENSYIEPHVQFMLQAKKKKKETDNFIFALNRFKLIYISMHYCGIVTLLSFKAFF